MHLDLFYTMINKQTIYYILFILYLIQGNYTPIYGQNNKELLKQLDETIAKRSYYQQQKEEDIKNLNQKLIFTANNPEEQFKVLGELFLIYRSYKVNQALTIAEQRIQLSQSLNKKAQLEAQMNKADALHKMGFYMEGLSQLNQISPQDSIPYTEYGNYIYHTIYLSLYEEENNQQKKEYYKNKLVYYTNLNLSQFAPGTYQYNSSYAILLDYQGEPHKAIRLLEKMYFEDQNYGDNKASIEYALANLYLKVNDTEKAEYYLILSSITDIQNAKKVYKSLQQLAIILFEQGDVERANNYIICALEDIRFGSARYRFDDIANYLPIINTAHQKHIEEQRRIAIISFIILLLFICSLTVAFIVIHKKNKKLTEAKVQLDLHNKQLEMISNNLLEMNKQIKEKDHIKEEYIGLLFHTCSDYIQKQSILYKNLNRIATSGHISDLSKFINEQQNKSEDLKSFIRHFDTIFLSIFPNFIQDFNSLLRPEERIQIKEGELLTPELRIYALIRLGIHDNTKIASSLHYSLQTVYNYRMKMRNKAISDKKDLAQQILTL